jgi:hypothetical protein
MPYLQFVVLLLQLYKRRMNERREVDAQKRQQELNALRANLR